MAVSSNGKNEVHRSIPGFTSRRTSVGGVPIHSKMSEGPGNTTAPPVVLVHGLGLSHRYMMPLAEQLARRYQVWLPDLPGFGDSGKSLPALKVPQLADALAAWLRACELTRPVLFGNSYGCQVIVDLAARFPAQVSRVVLQGLTVLKRGACPFVCRASDPLASANSVNSCSNAHPEFRRTPKTIGSVPRVGRRSAPDKSGIPIAPYA